MRALNLHKARWRQLTVSLFTVFFSLAEKCSFSESPRSIFYLWREKKAICNSVWTRKRKDRGKKRTKLDTVVAENVPFRRQGTCTIQTPDLQWHSSNSAELSFRRLLASSYKRIKALVIVLYGDLRACPGEDQAGATHAISPISMKLGLFEEFTIKPRSPKRFIF